MRAFSFSFCRDDHDTFQDDFYSNLLFWQNGNLGTADGGVFMEHAIWRMTYVGPPAVFAFTPVEGVRGTPAPSSIVQLGGMAYYLGEDGFYVFDGTNSIPIGANKVDKTFYATVDQNNMHLVHAAIDPINKMVFWAYPTTTSGGVISDILVYNWQIQKWSHIKQNLEWLFRSYSFGYTLDQIYTTLGYTFQTMPYPLSSRAWTGGNVLLSAFTTDHKLGYFTGSSMAATIETSEQAPSDPELTFINNTRPLVDGGSPTVAMATRNRLIDAPVYGVARSINSLGQCPLRATGRYIRATVQIPAGSSWNHFQGVQCDGGNAGAR